MNTGSFLAKLGDFRGLLLFVIAQSLWLLATSNNFVKNIHVYSKHLMLILQLDKTLTTGSEMEVDDREAGELTSR